MTNIAISDEVYQALVSLANERHVLPEELLAALIAQEQWEEHAATAYDAYHARTDLPHEVLTDEEFLQSLQDTAPISLGSADANV